MAWMITTIFFRTVCGHDELWHVGLSSRLYLISTTNMEMGLRKANSEGPLWSNTRVFRVAFTVMVGIEMNKLVWRSEFTPSSVIIRIRILKNNNTGQSGPTVIKPLWTFFRWLLHTSVNFEYVSKFEYVSSWSSKLVSTPLNGNAFSFWRASSADNAVPVDLSYVDGQQPQRSYGTKMFRR